MTLDETEQTAATSSEDPRDHTEAGLDLARRDLVCTLERLTGVVEGSIETPITGLALHRIMRPGGPKPAIQMPGVVVDRAGLEASARRGGGV